jgi:hypothetical protein
VFVTESLIVGVPLAVAQHRLLTFLHIGDLDSVAQAAYAEGATVHTGISIAGLAKTVAVQSIPAYQRGAVTVVPIRWVATGTLGGMFPVLDANVEMAAADGQTTLEIVGSYRPPFGKVGEAVDRLILHSVAQSTIRSFLGQLAAVAEELPDLAAEQIAPVPADSRRATGFPGA